MPKANGKILHQNGGEMDITWPQQKLFTLSKEGRESIKRNCWTELSPDANNFDAKNVADAIKEYSTTTTKCSALNFCIIKYDSSFFRSGIPQ